MNIEVSDRGSFKAIDFCDYEMDEKKKKEKEKRKEEKYVQRSAMTLTAVILK